VTALRTRDPSCSRRSGFVGARALRMLPAGTVSDRVEIARCVGIFTV
jgi:hypothetical protein